MLAPAQAGAGLVQGLPQRLADAIFQTWHDEWNVGFADATTQQLHLPRQGANDAGTGEGLDSWFDAVWKDFAPASSSS
jgi:hypothetical protein